jgi:hypothetical protein
MRTTVIRFLALACASSAALALSANALATPRLIVSGGNAPSAAAATTVQVTEDKADPAPLKITIYQATGYAATLGQPAGTQIGTVHADLQALAISADAIIQADGTVLAADPATYASNTCSPGAHAAVWLLHVTVSGQTIDVPVYLDPTSGAEAALGSAKLVLCLSDPYDTAPASIRAPFGVKLINAKMVLNSGIITNPATAGTFLWRATITPWNPATPAPDAAKTVEVQSVVTLPPGKATLKATVKKIKKPKHSVATVSGTVTENGVAVSGASVAIFANGKKVATVKTNANGVFAKAFTIKKATKFQAKVAVAQHDTACVSPLPTSSVPGGCVGASIGAWAASSPTVATKPKK